jgi:putative endonuclease
MAKARTPPAPERVAAFRNGVDAEARAADHLTARGYEIVAQRYKSPYGEIDLIVRHGGLIAFVEVKARRKIDDAAYAVTPRQQKRIIEAAQAWLAAHPDAAFSDLRFDAMLVAPGRAPRHLIAAFDASE